MSQTTRLIIITFVMIVASCVRLYNLQNNPAWYTDEGTHIEIARNLIDGKNQYLGISDSYLIVARLPLFEHLLAGWFRLFSVGMFQLRLLTVSIGLLTTAILYRMVYVATENTHLSVGVLVLFAVYPQAVIYSRFGFSYNLLAFFIIAGLYLLFTYFRNNNPWQLFASSLLFGLGTITDFIALSFMPVFILIILQKSRRHLLLCIVGITLPFFVYATHEILAQPDIFIHDLTYTLSRAGGIPLTQQLENVVTNIRILITQSWWMPIGFIGLFFVKQPQARSIFITVVFVPIIISGRTIALYNLSAYYMIPLLPFFCIGVATLLYYGISRLSFSVRVESKLYVLCIVILTLPTCLQLIHDVTMGFTVGIEHFLIAKSEAEQVRSVINDYAKADNLIITSPTLAWMFDTQVTDFQISSLTDDDSVHFPQSLYPSRFIHNIDYTTAEFAIVDNLWRDWGAVHMSPVADMLRNIQTWTLIFETDNIQVYQNP